MTEQSKVSSPDFALDAKALGSKLMGKLDGIRAASPIFWSEINNAWIVTGNAEVIEGYQGRLPLSSDRFPEAGIAQFDEAQRAELPNVIAAPKGWLLNMDPPAYNRLRQLMLRAFGSDVVEGIRPHVRRDVDELLNEAALIDGPIDFVRQIARIVPSRMVLRQFGLGDELLPMIERWTILNVNGNPTATFAQMKLVDEALSEMRSVFKPLLDDRRRNPGDDFLSYLVTANNGGDSLTEDELIGTCTITFIAGHDTTINTIALGTVLLAKNGEFVDQLRSHPEVLPEALMELQRVSAMSTLMSRVVKEDFEWRGHQLRKGEIVLLCQGAANRDPAVFPDPETPKLGRDQRKNLTFAPGMHHCIGHLLAKMMLSEFFHAFLNRFDVEILDETLDFAPAAAFRGLSSLNVRLHPRAT